MEALHFLYRIKNKPWEAFINSLVVPGLERGIYINFGYFVVVFPPLKHFTTN